jgi:tRNA threonylcarbamoyladenosine biosynthesis protein TsaE
MRTITLVSLQGLDEAAARFLELAGEQTVIAFSGEMGAGKTTFI